MTPGRLQYSYFETNLYGHYFQYNCNVMWIVQLCLGLITTYLVLNSWHLKWI